MIRRAAVGAAIVLTLAIAVAAYLTETSFLRYQPAVDRVVERIPPNERHLSLSARDVLTKTHPDSTRTYFVSVCLLAHVAPARVTMGEWHLRNMLWVLLLPRRFNQEQRLVLFAHFLPLEGGSGLEYGARTYFRKAASELTEDEVLQLVTIAGSPRAYSPVRDPDRFRHRLDVVRTQYRNGRS